MTPEQLKTVRLKLGLSQVKMAQILCLSEVSIRSYESGKREPSPLVLMAYRELSQGWIPQTLRTLRSPPPASE